MSQDQAIVPVQPIQVPIQLQGATASAMDLAHGIKSGNKDAVVAAAKDLNAEADQVARETITTVTDRTGTKPVVAGSVLGSLFIGAGILLGALFISTGVKMQQEAEAEAEAEGKN